MDGVRCRECDSPWTLTNLTLDYLQKEWAHNIDFVICASPPLFHFFYVPSIRSEADASPGSGDNARLAQTDDAIFPYQATGLKSSL
jgi:hypothetical protein